MGVAEVPTPTLRRLRELLASGQLVPPLSGFQLRSHGLTALEGTPLLSLPVEALTAVVDLVLDERRRSDTAEPELVWTGPEGTASGARDTAVLLRELFVQARRSVLIAGFRFDHGSTLLEPLHATMKAHGVSCTLFADGAQAAEFVRREWPFGPPFPDVYADARGEQFSSLHAKCVVVDDSKVLVTSANFTDRGQRRNIEVGVLLHDVRLASTLGKQWMTLVSSGAFKRVGDPC